MCPDGPRLCLGPGAGVAEDGVREEGGEERQVQDRWKLHVHKEKN